MAQELDNHTSKTDKVKNQDRTPLFNSLIADVAGVILTAASSVGAAILMVDKSFFRNAEREKRFQKFHAIRDSERASPKTTSLKGHDWLVRIREIEQQHDRSIIGELNEMGLRGPLEKFKSLHAHQKREVAFTSLAVAAGAIGVASSIIGNRITAQKERELSDKLDSLEEKTVNGHAK